eukprot:4241069-Amphidinium_carterae.1
MLTTTPTGQGYELWRRLVAEYEPRTGSRSASLLVQILSYPLEGTDLTESMEKWEQLIKRHDETVGPGEELQ